VEALDGGFLQRSVPPLDLIIAPRMAGLGQPVLDAVLGAGTFKGVCTDDLIAVHRRADQRVAREERSFSA